MSDKTFNRDTKGDDYRGPQKDSASKEIADLLKIGASDYDAYKKLKPKYSGNPEQLEKILDQYKEKLHRLTKKARKFKEVLQSRYGPFNLPFPDLVKKAKKYAKKLKLADEEFDMFITLIQSEKLGSYATLPHNKLSKVLGYDAIMASESRLDVKPDEASIVEEIVNKYGETKPLHAQVVLQSLTYKDCAPEALTGVFDKNKQNPYAYIHPVIAALFFPKIDYLDEQMLIANIGYIVKCKKIGTPIMTKPDFDLYYAMITDPNDSACDATSAIKDLRNRFALQCELWDSVLNLRQGKYYYNDMGQLLRFMKSLENCRNIIHDAPDLTYVKDEGTILRRLLSAFSIHPTIVSVNRLWGLVSGPQVSFGGQTPFDPVGYSNITSVPMITLRLPLNISGVAPKPVALDESLTQPQWFVENKVIVPKALQIVHSKNVLFFYVGRRYQNINVTRLNTPYCFTNLPMTVTGWESLNETPVNAPKQMMIMNDTFILRSVVAVEKTQVQRRNLIIGSTALVVKPRNIEAGDFQETYFVYDPQGAGEMFKDGDSYTRNGPITVIPGETPFSASGDAESFTSRASTRGTIFMYQKVGSATPCM